MMYPEHEKLQLRAGEHAAVVNFLNWCEDKGYTLTVTEPPQSVHSTYYPVTRNVKFADAIADWLDIDAAALEAEKQDILKGIVVTANRKCSQPGCSRCTHD